MIDMTKVVIWLPALGLALVSVLVAFHVYHRLRERSRQLESLLAKSEQRFDVIFNQPFFAISTYDASGRIVSWNEATEQLWGMTSDQMSQAARQYSLFDDDQLDRLGLTPLMRRASTGTCETFSMKFYDPERSVGEPAAHAWPRWVSGGVMGVRSSDSVVREMIIMLEDSSETLRTAEENRLLAFHDQLTGLPNRAQFTNELRLAIDSAAANGAQVAIAVLEIDRFRRINDSLGQAEGDEVLQLLASRLTTGVGWQGIVSRADSDEFLLCLSGVAGAEAARHRIAGLLKSLRDPIRIGGRSIHLTASVGLSFYPVDGTEAEILIRKADIAMLRAKERGVGTIAVYTDSLNRSMKRRMSLEWRLRQALDRGELLLHFQPRLDLDAGKVVAVEALLRWRDPGDGIMLPGEFIDVAEESGLIVPIGLEVLRMACAQAASWRELGHEGIKVSVNLSARQLREVTLVEDIATILNATGLDPGALELELTESSVMNHVQSAVEVMHRLTALGIRLAIDDFGKGYSSLQYLKQFPIDMIKIDRSFVEGIPDEAHDVAIVRAVLAMAKSLGLDVVAEGVSSWQQQRFLESERCDQIQGFFYCPPVPAEELTALLEAQADPGGNGAIGSGSENGSPPPGARLGSSGSDAAARGLQQPGSSFSGSPSGLIARVKWRRSARASESSGG